MSQHTRKPRTIKFGGLEILDPFASLRKEEPVSPSQKDQGGGFQVFFTPSPATGSASLPTSPGTKTKKTLRDFGLGSDAPIGSPEATQFLLGRQVVPAPVTPTATEATPVTGGITDVIRDKIGDGTRDALIDRLATARAGAEAFKPSERFRTLGEERGLPGIKEQIGTFDEEIAKTTDFLDRLEEDIKARTGGFIVGESARRRIEAAEREPLTRELGRLTTAREAAAGRLERERTDILTQLGFEKAEAGAPLEALREEIDLRGGIEALDGGKEVFDLATTIAESGASRDQIEDILNAGSREEALAIAAETGFLSKKDVDQGFTLSPGQIRFDKEGNAIATGGPRPATEAEITKALEKGEKDEQARSTQVSTIGLVNTILGDPNFNRVIGGGAERFFSAAGLAGTAGVRGQIQQLKALTALEGRTQLKGSGTISDFEARMLAESANALNAAITEDGQISMTDEDAERALKNIRGILISKAGETVTVLVTDPETGETRRFTDQTREDVEDASLQGFIVNYE